MEEPPICLTPSINQKVQALCLGAVWFMTQEVLRFVSPSTSGWRSSHQSDVAAEDDSTWRAWRYMALLWMVPLRKLDWIWYEQFCSQAFISEHFNIPSIRLPVKTKINFLLTQLHCFDCWVTEEKWFQVSLRGGLVPLKVYFSYCLGELLLTTLD